MSDQNPTPEREPQEPAGAQQGGARRLLRSRDRMIAGVAGGLGNYFNVDANIVRIVFALSILFGGLGVLVYAGLAIFVPEEGDRPGETKPPLIERSRGLAVAAGAVVVILALSWGLADFDPWPFDRGWFFGGPLLFLLLAAGAYYVVRGTGRVRDLGWVGAIVFGTVAFFGLALAFAAALWAGATGHGVVIASLLIGIGVMLVVAAFNGGARWLIAPALALAFPLGFVAATDLSFADGFGERQYRPSTIESLPDDGSYELGIGRLVVDLRSIDWQPGDVVELDVDLGIGQAVVAVPEDLCVVSDISAGMGAIHAAGDDAAGFEPDHQLNLGADVTPRLELDGEIDLGEFRLVNSDDADVDDPGPWHDRGDSGASRAAMEAACAPPDEAGGERATERDGDEGRGQAGRPGRERGNG